MVVGAVGGIQVAVFPSKFVMRFWNHIERFRSVIHRRNSKKYMY